MDFIAQFEEDNEYSTEYTTPEEHREFLDELTGGMIYVNMLEEYGMIRDLAKIVNSYISNYDCFIGF